MLIGGSRVARRVFLDKFIRGEKSYKRTLIVGAGDAGAMIIRQLKNPTNDSELKPVAIVDDDPQKQRMQLYDLLVLGEVDDIQRVVRTIKIEHIMLSIQL